MATNPNPPSSNLPQPLSYEEILGQQLSSYAASTGVNDLNTASANVSFMQMTALMVARSSGDIFQILRDFSLSRATGPALQNLAIEYGVPPLPSAIATGFVTVTDLSFQKIATKIYAGANPPNIGSTTIFVSDASLFPATGQVYLGRGSVNIEGPLPYSAKTQIGSFWSLTLSSATTKFHNISESVILAQGGVRTVPVNAVVISPGIGTTPDIQYSVTQNETILDGETTITNVPITALLPGAAGNVPASAISKFSGNPSGLSNASISNPLAITTGADIETDNQLRVRVKNKLASTGLGTVTAIESALQGVQDPSSSATIVSTDILNNSSNTIVYIDDGTGYEAIHASVPIETIVNSALGGEKFFQLVTGGTQTSVTKAFLQTVALSPFNLSGGEHLSIIVGNITYEHVFIASDFANPGSATAYEVCASINADTSLNYEAVTAGGGTYVVIRPEDEKTNIIQVTTPSNSLSIDANNFLQFPSQKAETLRLYKNGILLTEDGSTASIFTQSQSLWSSTLANGETLSLSVDGTAPITYTLTDAMFVAEGTYTTLSNSNSLQSWINVLNNNITGITASIVGSQIEISSNLGPINRAEITVVNTISNPTSLISKGIISNTDLSSMGVQSDYILDRNTAQIQLSKALVKGDVLSAGTLVTRANIKAGAEPSGSITLTSDAHVWISIDTNATIIPTIKNGSTLSVSKVGLNTVRYTSNSASDFSNVLPGDYVIVWSTEIPLSDRLEGRVHAKTGSTLDIKVTAAEYTAATVITNATFIQGFVVIRTANVPQKFRVLIGTKTLDVIAAELQTQTNELVFGVFNNTNITISTNTEDTVGQITTVTADASGFLLGFTSIQNSISQSSLSAFYESQATTSELPLFFHSTISADSYAEPIDSYLTNFSSTLSLSQFDPNEMIQFLNPYGIVPGTILDDEQPALENVQMSAISGTSVTILPVYPDVRRLRVSDRYFVANPLDFGYNDKVIVIVDNNTVGETYTLPLYRRAIVNSIYPANNYSFDAYDVDAGPTASFTTNFANFDFSNFKVLMQPKFVLQESDPQSALLFRSTIWGRGGEDINVSYIYPTSANKPINSVVTVTNTINIAISLISGNPISSFITGNTQWNVAVTPNTPIAGVDQVTYTYAGTYTFTVTAANATAGAVYSNNGQLFTVNSTIIAGTSLSMTAMNGAPLTSGTLTLVSGSGDATITFSSRTFLGFGPAPSLSLSGGEYVTILPTTGFNIGNTGTFKVSTAVGFTPTSTSFSVQVPTGTASAQSGVLTIILNGISFYTATPTTAAAINTYVNANLSKYITTTIVDDGGTTGSGIIALSSYENSGFVTSSYFLKDGINWIASNGQYIFTVTAANATVGSLYKAINGQLFTVTATIIGGISLSTTGSIGTPLVSGTLTLISGTGDINITFSSVSVSPQFTLKKPLTYYSDTGYSFFTSGEEIRLIPTTMDQVQKLWSILAVTGFTTVGSVKVVDRGTKLQLATNTLGSIGSIQIVGGSGNEYSVPILTSGELVGNNHMSVEVNNIASQAVMSDQWFRLQALNYQNKDTGLAANTSVTILSNSPIGGESTVTFLNQSPNQLYFGGPRKNIRVDGDTFRIEKQGSLTCLSWDGVGTSPAFSSPLNFNDVGNWTVNVLNGTYTSVPSIIPPSPPPSPLGSASTYGILAASAITNSVGTSIVNGDLGEYSGSTLTGTFTITGATHLGDSTAQTAQNDALSAFTAMQTLGLAGSIIPSALDGQTLTPGSYHFASGAATLASSGAGTLTLNGAGTYIIYTASTLTTGAGGMPTITLTGGALAKDIYWIVGSSATINAGTAGTFNGNIIAQTSITNTMGGIVNGSMIALTAAITLSAVTTINVPASPPALPLPVGNTNFAALSIGDLITVSGLTNAGNNGTFFVTGLSLDGLSFSVSNPLSVTESGTIILAGAFSATSSVSEGDTMILSSPFAPLNEGEYRVIRRFNDSVWYENLNSIEEEVTCTANTISTGFDSTTVFNVSVSGGMETLTWNGTGLAPFLGLALPGDVITLSSGFAKQYVFTISSGNATAGATYTNNAHTFTVLNTISAQTTLVCSSTGDPTASGTLTKTSGTGDATITFSAFTSTPANQGSFAVTQSGPSQQQVVQLNMPSGATFTSSGPGEYFEIYNGGNANQYYVWYNVLGGSNTDPAPVGFTGIQVNVNNSDSPTTVASETNTALAALVAMTHSASGNVVTVTANIAAATNIPVDVSMPSAFTFTVTQLGQRSFLSLVNPLGIVQSGISSVTFTLNRPQIQFFPYEATVPGDKLVVNGPVLGFGNSGIYQILQVLNPNTIIVSGTISQQYNNNLSGNFTSISVQEGTKYTGYKQVLYIAPQPGSIIFNDIVFNTSAQYNKINLSANISMTALGKLNFPTTVRNGIDSYNYDTGLIGEANRVTYGDPRDAITYPGVSAAGTNIFIREPLLHRIKIALAIRTNIGISFAQITSQIQSSIFALIQANPLGKSLDLSQIVETVRLIPGVTSVVLTSPAYTVSNDEIKLVTGEKAFIVNQVSDISVSLIGS